MKLDISIRGLCSFGPNIISQYIYFEPFHYIQHMIENIRQDNAFQFILYMYVITFYNAHLHT